MAIRSAVARIPKTTTSVIVGVKMEGVFGGRTSARYFGDGKGRVLSEEERAKETVYIQKMERERLEKLRKKLAEKEKAEAEKAKSTTDQQKTEGSHKN